MAKALTVKRVEKLLRAGVPGKHTDADVRGLMLAVESKTSAAWLLRWQRDGRVRHMGLGSARDLSLAAAREKARRERERIANGTDPLELKRKDRVAQREAEARLLTFRQAAERLPRGAGGRLEQRRPCSRIYRFAGKICLPPHRQPRRRRCREGRSAAGSGAEAA
jgi:hypothetical protein